MFWRYITAGLLIIAIVLFIQSPIWLKAYRTHQKDHALLKKTPALKHFALSLNNPAIKTPADLFEQAKEFQFNFAPDPSQFLKSMHEKNGQQLKHISSLNGQNVKILSYNVALLDVDLLGVIDYKQTPYLNVRRQKLPFLIFSEEYDIIFLQEVWKDEDVHHFKKIAQLKDYQPFANSREHYNDGLMTFVRKSFLQNAKPTFITEPFEVQDPFEFFPGPQILRGFQYIGIMHHNLGRLHLYNTHFLAWPQNWFERMQQARELGLYINSHSRAKDISLLGGDINNAPYYKNDFLILPDKTTISDWWKNSLAYSILLHYGDLNDLIVMGKDVNQADSDVTLANGFVDINPAWCQKHLTTTFTATDCNQLYEKQYKGTEYPARLDHLLARDLKNRLVVLKSGLTFTNKIAFTNKILIEPSDHYGIFAEVLIRFLDNAKDIISST